MPTSIITIDQISFKREDQNFTGSAKDRAIPTQLEFLKKHNISDAVISSTGNAAISADHYCHQYGINLTVFVSPNINPDKLRLITHSQIITSPSPVSDAFKFAKDNGVFNLRQSTDPQALIGYSQIGEEINSQLPQVTSVFFPVGSGTTMLGTASKLNPAVKIFAVQPASHPSIVQIFDHNYYPEANSLTDSLGVKYLPQKSKIISLIKDSKGFGVAVQNKELLEAEDWLIRHQIYTSAEGALALAGYFKSKRLQLDTGSTPLIILTGANRHESH